MNIFRIIPDQSDAALVVFSNHTGIRWMRLLPRGFRHCFVILRQGEDDWLMVDSLPGRIALQRLDTAATVRLLRLLIRRGDRVLPARVAGRADRRGRGRIKDRARRMRPYTCVELSIRLLGYQTLNVLTPSRLFRFLSGFCERYVDK